MEVKSRVEASRLPVRGIAWGVAAVLAWALYNVGAKLGVAQGFQSQDLTLMRYGVAGLLMLPLLLRGGLGSLGWGRGLMLTLCVGPLFGLVVNTGFVLAPLAHGVVLPPAATMISTTLLAWAFAGERPKVAQLIGIVILLTGLVAIAWDGLNAGTGQAVWLGDLAFIAAGTMWGTFTTLLKRWRVDAVSATAIVSVFSMVVFVPGYLIIYGLPQLPAQALASQAVFQGLLGGCFGVIAYGMTVASLGPGRAALFPALVPAAATLIAVPLLGQVPGGLQFAGILLSSLGLLTAFVLSARDRSVKVSKIEEPVDEQGMPTSVAS